MVAIKVLESVENSQFPATEIEIEFWHIILFYSGIDINVPNDINFRKKFISCFPIQTNKKTTITTTEQKKKTKKTNR